MFTSISLKNISCIVSIPIWRRSSMELWFELKIVMKVMIKDLVSAILGEERCRGFKRIVFLICE